MAADMAENANPGEMHISAYTKWGTGEWGGLVTGMYLRAGCIRR